MMIAATIVARAQEPPGAASAHFAIEHRAIDSGGGKSTSSHFEIASSLDSFGEVSISASHRVQTGFFGQIFEPIGPINLGIAIQSNGDHIVRIQGAPNHTYQLQSAPSLVPPINWSGVGAPRVAPSTGLLNYQQTRSVGARFYRAIEP